MSKIEKTVIPFYFARGALASDRELHEKKVKQDQLTERKKFQQEQQKKTKKLHKLLMAELGLLFIAGFTVAEELKNMATENAKKLLALLPKINITNVTVGNSQYTAVEAPFKISDEFAAIIDAKIDYEESAIEDIVEGLFIGPLPEDQHNLRQDFQSGALGDRNDHRVQTDYQAQMRALRGMIEYGGRNYLTENLFNQLAKENAELTLEGDRPTIVFRLTQPSFRFSPDRRATNELIPIHVPK